ncbi:hypothetical protein [Deinococcus ruber]|uniref:Uncharacterized protein n=1 Tax=Deinococcus ruber TaxID=1848197 RepID=A0A918C8A6_9DEIO|nr:hypothetical protein [Deinococcus ruber]GGR09867.1 hypothetical protein GCM10008957_23290 [Deinococcus ruber]
MTTSVTPSTSSAPSVSHTPAPSVDTPEQQPSPPDVRTLFGSSPADTDSGTQLASTPPLHTQKRQATEHIYLHLDQRQLTLFRTFRQHGMPSARFTSVFIEHPDIWRQVVVEIAKFAQKDRTIFVHHNSAPLINLIRTYRQDEELRTFIERERYSLIRSAPAGRETALWQDVLSLFERGEVPKQPIGVDAHIYSAAVSDGVRNYWGWVVHTPSELVLRNGYVDIHGEQDLGDLITAEMVALREALTQMPTGSRCVVYPSQPTVKFVYDDMVKPRNERDVHLNGAVMRAIIDQCTKRKMGLQTGEKPNPVLMKHARAIAALGYAGREVL